MIIKNNMWQATSCASCDQCVDSCPLQLPFTALFFFLDLKQQFALAHHQQILQCLPDNMNHDQLDDALLACR